MYSIIIGTFGYGFGLRPKTEGFMASATASAKNFAFGRPLIAIDFHYHIITFSFPENCLVDPAQYFFHMFPYKTVVMKSLALLTI